MPKNNAMTKRELVKLDSMLAAFQRHLDSKYTLTQAFERAIWIRKDVEREIAALEPVKP